MKHLIKSFDYIKFYGLFGLLVVAVTFYLIFVGLF